MRAVTDEQLIQWVASGDPSCLATLFERHHRSVYQFCLTMTRQRALSEDLVQDVFLKLLKNAKAFRNEGSFKAWMFKIARNVTLDSLRKTKRQNNQPLHLTGEDDSLVDHLSAEHVAAGSQKMQQVLNVLAQLPTAVQEVIWLGRFEFDNYAELGQALACNEGTARVRMHRAMTLLNSTYTNLHGAPIND